MKKGFTLIELLAVIILLSLLLILVYPRILEQLEKKEVEIDGYTKDLIFNAANEYISKDLNTYPNIPGRTYYVPVNTLDQENLIAIEVEDELINKCVQIKMGANGNTNYELIEKCP